MTSAQRVGQGDFRYRVDASWGRRAGGVPSLGVAQGVAGDARDRVYVFQRAPTTEVLVFEPDGTLVDRWGDGQFTAPHGIWISPQDELYLTDMAAHTVNVWTPGGAKLRQWGTAGVAGAPGEPFHGVSKAVVTPDGEMYVSDGYGNRRVHRFSATGELLTSWGEGGEGPGQFALVHDVWVDSRDQVLICDRENDRVQRFDRAGAFLDEWPGLGHPMQIFERDDLLYLAHADGALSVRTLDGEVLAQWPYQSQSGAGVPMSPHSLWVDSRGDMYVGEVTGANGLQKLLREG